MAVSLVAHEPLEDKALPPPHPSTRRSCAKLSTAGQALLNNQSHRAYLQDKRPDRSSRKKALRLHPSGWQLPLREDGWQLAK